MLVTSEELRRHLNLTSTDAEDPDILANLEMYRNAASEIVIDYIKRPDHEWTATDCPYLIKAAVLLVAADMFEDRETATINESVRNILTRYRDPTLA